MVYVIRQQNDESCHNNDNTNYNGDKGKKITIVVNMRK